MDRAALSEMSLPALRARYDELCKEEAAREQSVAMWTKKLADSRLVKGTEKVENSVDTIIQQYVADVRKSHDYIAAKVAQLEIDAVNTKNVFENGINAIRVLTEQTKNEDVKLRKIRDEVKIHLMKAKEQQAAREEKAMALTTVFESAVAEDIPRLSCALDLIRQNLAAKNDSLDQKLEEMRTKNEEIQAEKNMKEEILVKIRNEVEQIKIKKSNFEKEANEAREESAVIQAQLDAQSAARRERKEVQAELETESARLEEDLEKLNGEHVAAMTEQAELQAQIEEELPRMDALEVKEHALEEDRTCEEIKEEFEGAKALLEEKKNVAKRRTEELKKLLEGKRMKLEVTLEVTRWQMPTRSCQELEERRKELIRLREQKIEQASKEKDALGKMMKEVEQAKQKLAALSGSVSEKRNDREDAEARLRHLQRKRQDDFDTFKVNLELAKRRREMAEREMERVKQMPVGVTDETFQTPVVLSRKKESTARIPPPVLRNGFSVEAVGSYQIPSLGCHHKSETGFQAPEDVIDFPQPTSVKKKLPSSTSAKETSKPPATPLKTSAVQPAEAKVTPIYVEVANGMGCGAEEEMDVSCSVLELQTVVDTSLSTELLAAANTKIQQWQIEPAGNCSNSLLLSERERAGITALLLDVPGTFHGNEKTPSEISDSMQSPMQSDVSGDEGKMRDGVESGETFPRSIGEYFQHLEASPPPARQITAPVPSAFMDFLDTSDSDANVSVWSQTGF